MLILDDCTSSTGWERITRYYYNATTNSSASETIRWGHHLADIITSTYNHGYSRPTSWNYSLHEDLDTVFRCDNPPPPPEISEPEAPEMSLEELFE